MRSLTRSVLAVVLAGAAATACTAGEGDAEPDVVETTFEGNAATEVELPDSSEEDGVPEDDPIGTEDGEE